MYAVGHLALGYLLGKGTSKLLHVNANVPLIFVASIIHDADLLIPGLEHRGPSHALILYLLLLLATFLLYGKRALPYGVAMSQHLAGDFLTEEGIRLLWPITPHWYGMGIAMASLTNILLEWIFFLAFISLLFKAKDIWVLLRPHPSNLLLSIPVLTSLLPLFYRFPHYVPLELVIPYLTYLIIFTLSLLTYFSFTVKGSGPRTD